MSDEEKNLPVPVVTDAEPQPDPTLAKQREEAYKAADRGTQPHAGPGTLTDGGRKI